VGSSSREILEKMRANLALARDLGLPPIDSDYWRELLARGRQEHGGKQGVLDREDLWTDFRRNVITKGLDNANVPEEALARVREKCRVIHERISPEVPAELHPLFEESPIGNPRTHEIGRASVTQSSLEYTYMLSHLNPHLGNARVVVDIGGGYGGLVRLLKLVRPHARFLLLDLPEVNAIQTYFLSRAFPGANVLGLSDVVAIEVIDPRSLDFDFLVLPGQLFDRVAPSSFEAVINTRSMMEMDLPTVGFYLRNIQEKLPEGGVFYCLNRYEKKTRLKDYPFDDRWRVAYEKPWPSFVDQNPHHEIVAIRAREPVEPGLRGLVRGFPPRGGFLDRMRAILKD
jgi:putative sugar O-methyltransferase